MLAKKSFYPFLFILFYLIFNVIEVRNIIRFSYFTNIFCYSVLGLLIVAICCYPFYKNWRKCFLFSFIVLFFYFQYGSIHTSISKIKALHVIAQHSVLLFIIFLLIIVCFFFIKKWDIDKKIILALNIVYIFLLFFIIFKLIYINNVEKKTSIPMPYWANTTCDTCKKPDIYLLVYDEYASSISLKRRFNFDNSLLDSFLLAEKFNIQAHSKSNYNITDFSMLSFFNAEYLPNFVTKNYYTKKEEIKAIESFKQTNFINFLQKNHYNINNYSFFPLLNNTRESDNSPIFSSHIVLSNSLYYKLAHDIGAIIIQYKLYKNIFKKTFYQTKYQTAFLRNSFLNALKQPKQNNQPSFYYLHQLSPHEPFYYDKDGNEATFKTSVPENEKTKAYLEYAQYSNKKIIDIISQIKKVSNGNAIIVFIGDHGYRSNLINGDKEYFANQSAVYFPDKNYHFLNDSTSNVNLPRIILNKYFNLNLPLLKDSSIFIGNNFVTANKKE